VKGKTIVITGGTSGIGESAAKTLAEMGARIVLIARDKQRGDATLARLRECGPGLAHSVHLADLTRLPEMKRVAAQIANEEPRIDALINNAGALFTTRHVTPDGLECTFALNHMAYFVITEGLRERLVATAPARVVSTSSVAHHTAALDFSDLQSKHGYGGGLKAYKRSKLCNILFTRELARRLQGTGVTGNCVNPGFVATRFGDESGGLVERLIWRAAKIFAISPAEGAKTIVHLVSSPAVAETTGKYFYKCRESVPSRAARDDQKALLLWERSAGIIEGKT
jgi:NAD(P)-dependent dehydrogenase (short-subunit alcohol dehydrogenase family)